MLSAYDARCDAGTSAVASVLALVLISDLSPKALLHAY